MSDCFVAKSFLCFCCFLFSVRLTGDFISSTLRPVRVFVLETHCLNFAQKNNQAQNYNASLNLISTLRTEILAYENGHFETTEIITISCIL